MSSRARTIRLCVLSAALLVSAGASAGQDPFARKKRVETAIRGGTGFLLSTISDSGAVHNEFPQTSHLYGGRTALTAYALLAAEVPVKTANLRLALGWLLEAKLYGTYAVALRACALAAWNDPKVIDALRRDAKWLMNAAGADGTYTYTSKNGKAGGGHDNSNTQMALLGLWAAERRGVKVPDGFWKLTERHWLDTQRPDGGWNYRAGSGNASYGSMTAAGLASLFIIFDAVHRKDFVNAAAQSDYTPITRSLKWMEDNFAADRNPGHIKWWYYWLYSVERVGAASGYKYFGKHDWYAEGTDRLLASQHNAGWWEASDTPQQTAFAILFLVRGRYSVLVNKLKYRGKWNSRPRDMANLTRWLSWQFESPVSWQIVEIDSPPNDWHDAPILYISGAGACEFSDRQIEKLRNFVLEGGLILSEAAGSSGDFTLDMQKYYRDMFPTRPMERLAKDHRVYTMHFQPGSVKGLSVISNGIRPLVIHSPRELSLALQLGYGQANRPNREVFELLANLYLFATDKGVLLPRGASYWPKTQKFVPQASITIARVKYQGNWNPEPLALERLAIRLGNSYALKLAIAPPVEIADLDAKSHPIGVMTGTDSFTLSKDQADALRRYFREGGTLIIDAAGGSRDFDRSVRSQILPLPDDAVEGPVASMHPVFFQPAQAHRPTYRREFAMALGSARRQPRLRAVRSGDRIAIIHSRDDLTAGLVGYQLNGLRGYSPASAAALMTNIVCHVGGYPAGHNTPTPAPTDRQLDRKEH